LKKSRDLAITGLVEWNDMAALLMEAVLKALLRYLRKYPHVLVAPLLLEHYPEDGGPSQRLGDRELTGLDDESLLMIVQQLLRPGAINLQRYTANKGGYPYWHCNCIQEMPMGKHCIVHCCGQFILMMTFTRAKRNFSTSERR
jgi:hypothetical protein